MIPVTRELQLSENNITERFVLSRGPGGQKVNRTATTVQLRYDLEGADLPDDVKERLRHIAGRRLDKEGNILIRARRYRSLEQNRRDARKRLVKLVKRAAERQKPRRPRRGESRRARQARLTAKHQHSEKKRMRAAVSAEE